MKFVIVQVIVVSYKLVSTSFNGFVFFGFVAIGFFFFASTRLTLFWDSQVLPIKFSCFYEVSFGKMVQMFRICRVFRS